MSLNKIKKYTNEMIWCMAEEKKECFLISKDFNHYIFILSKNILIEINMVGAVLLNKTIKGDTCDGKDEKLFLQDIIKGLLEKYKLYFVETNDPAKSGADAIADGKIIGWFQGRLEMGPRALGNRSILADPRLIGMNDKVNLIKQRELWRPLAPSIMQEYASEVFEENFESPYMLYTFKIKKDYQKKIPAVCHVDGTSRPQTVSKKSNTLLWRLLDEFRKITGVPLVLNTSFNGPGEPLVCFPEDAIKMFLRSKLDILIIGNYIVKK